MFQLSVVVCTYNRAEMLSNALESLVQQTLDKCLYEIIVVDNASSDATPEVLRNLRTRYGEWNIVLAREDRLGLGYGRNAGVRAARGTYVAFMDDDARADKDWLKLALGCFEYVKPRPFVVGGPILPFYESPKPAWFKDEYEIRTWGQKPRFLKQGESFSGSNIIFNKDIIEKYGGFDVHVGMKGPHLSVGEETNLFEKIWKHHGNASVFYYLPHLMIFHAVPDYKMTVSYQLKRAFVGGQSCCFNGAVPFLGRSKYLLKIIFSLAKLCLLLLVRLRCHSACQNWAVESFAPILSEMGRLMGCLGFHIPVRQR